MAEVPSALGNITVINGYFPQVESRDHARPGAEPGGQQRRGGHPQGKTPPGNQKVVHVSEISNERVEKPEDKLSIGEEIKAKILKVDRIHKKIGLSIAKAAQDVEQEEFGAYLNKEASTLNNNTMKEQLENLNK